MTTVFTGIDLKEAVAAADTRIIYPDGRVTDNEGFPKVWPIGPRMLLVTAESNLLSFLPSPSFFRGGRL